VERHMMNDKDIELKARRHTTRWINVRIHWLQNFNYSNSCQKHICRIKTVEHIIEVKTASQNTEQEVKIWWWIMSLLEWYGAEGMSSDETSVEGMEIIYHIKILLWRCNIDKYLDCIDSECQQPAQELFSRSGSRPTKRIHCGENLISTCNAIPGLPIELYDTEWLKELDEDYRQLTLCILCEQFEWMNIWMKSQESKKGDGGSGQ